MTESKNVLELLNKIEEFEKTIKGLEANVEVLKKKLADAKAKYGDDISQWPKDAK
jgi:archaellum component FlaC